MGRHEYERNKPIVWAILAAGILAGRTDNGNAAIRADKMLDEFEKRFLVEGEDE